MEELTILDNLITQLDKLNYSILYSVDSKTTKTLQKNKVDLVSLIDKQCQITKKNLDKIYHTNFNDLIKKYIIIQEKYRDTETNIYATQLVMMNPDLTMEMATAKIKGGYDTENILCLVNPKSLVSNANENLNYVTLRHKEIMKLERSIQELHELFISTYAIVMDQGETIDRIATTTNNAKTHISGAKRELKIGLKYKK